MTQKQSNALEEIARTLRIYGNAAVPKDFFGLDESTFFHTIRHQFNVNCKRKPKIKYQFENVIIIELLK